MTSKKNKKPSNSPRNSQNLLIFRVIFQLLLKALNLIVSGQENQDLILLQKGDFPQTSDDHFYSNIQDFLADRGVLEIDSVWGLKV
jgi:hypothetical protein